MKNFLSLKDVIQARTSVRSYKNTPVSRDDVNKMIEAAQEAPSSCNLQLIQYVVVDDIVIQKALAKISGHKLLWAPTNIIVCADTRFTKARDSGMVSLGASVQNMLLTATSLGLGACPMAGFGGDRKLKKQLGIPKYLTPILIVGVGYFDEVQKERERIPLEKIIHWNSFSEKILPIQAGRNLLHWSVADIKNYRQRIAPVYLYKNHFRLQTFSKDVYEAVYTKTEKYMQGSKSILDLFSYDGIWFGLLPLSFTKRTVSDYIPYTNKVLTGSFSKIDSVFITEENTIQAEDMSYDLITCIHKIEFTPQSDKIISEAYRVLKSDGVFIISASTNSFFKRVLYGIRWMYKRFLLKKTINVYENNQFYKIGPRTNISQRRLNNMLKEAGFKIIDKGDCVVGPKRFLGHRFFYIVCKK